MNEESAMHANRYKLVKAAFCLLLLTSAGGCLADGKGQIGQPVQRSDAKVPGKTADLGIARKYSESDLDDIFTGKTAEPQSGALEAVVRKVVSEVLGKPLFFSHVGAFEKENRQVEKGFSIGQLAFQRESVRGKMQILCGVRRGERWSLETVKFADAEDFLKEKILNSEDEKPNFEHGSFKGASIGEAVWHRGDQKTGDYEIVWLRGLTIVQIKVNVTDDADLKKSIGEKLDAAAKKLDEWIASRMR
jgi:hypothetical protein